MLCAFDIMSSLFVSINFCKHFRFVDVILRDQYVMKCQCQRGRRVGFRTSWAIGSNSILGLNTFSCALHTSELAWINQSTNHCSVSFTIRVNEKRQDLSSVYLLSFQANFQQKHVRTLTYFKIIALFKRDGMHIKRACDLEHEIFFLCIQTSIDYLVQWMTLTQIQTN